jgi:hypothetical protein
MDIISSLYKEYIDNSIYVFYKDHGNIIIFEKTDNDLVCISETYPKKYIGNNLKIVLMFSIKDPYKLVAEAYKYKMTDELVKSYCYKDIKEAFCLYQTYTSYPYWIKTDECYCDNDVSTGLYQAFHISGNIRHEGQKINGKYDGVWTGWHDNGTVSFIGTYVNGKKQGLWREWKETGEVDDIHTKTY